ncbi:hypothetical protein BCR35DRAFT_264397 [Leucosporidium creatinivorum]|uniref:TNase-like domain-containing protein n=1 Tax=Leucosporidium creatinivorum TaxID=106004 RepID=A0A1Y2FPU1_9BASI|nr:hypothetical protein BCR35DRAFT_264397 [Leucosporidium creatinivorum]
MSWFRSQSPTANSSNDSTPDSLPASLTRLHYTNPLLVAGSTALVGGASFRLWHRYLRRIPNADYITQEHLGKRRLRGVVTSVGDADNFRIYHKPTFSLPLAPFGASQQRRLALSTALKDQTIHIRLAGVDAPELAHFGKPAQPFAAEALDWLTKAVHGRTVHVDVLRKDRYGRVVGMAYVRRFPWLFRRNVSEEMLKAGYATVYTQGGAEHAGLLSRFQEVEAAAKARKIGMWSQSARSYESPADFKKRTAKE